MDRPLWLYGNGRLGALAREYFAAVGLSVAGTFEHDEYAPLGARIAVAIVTAPYRPIERRLRQRGFTDIWPVYDLMEHHWDGKHPLRNGWRTKLTEDDLPKIAEINQGWYDTESRWHHAAFVNWRSERIEVPNSVAPLEQQHAIPEIIGRVNDKTGVPTPFVKLHLEGGELAALMNLVSVISAYRPILSFNVDHNPDGIWRTSHWLMRRLEDYNFLFRNHVWCAANSIIYAIPQECR